MKVLNQITSGNYTAETAVISEATKRGIEMSRASLKEGYAYFMPKQILHSTKSLSNNASVRAFCIAVNPQGEVEEVRSIAYSALTGMNLGVVEQGVEPPMIRTEKRNGFNRAVAGSYQNNNEGSAPMTMVGESAVMDNCVYTVNRRERVYAPEFDRKANGVDMKVDSNGYLTLTTANVNRGVIQGSTREFTREQLVEYFGESNVKNFMTFDETAPKTKAGK